MKHYFTFYQYRKLSWKIIKQKLIQKFRNLASKAFLANNYLLNFRNADCCCFLYSKYIFNKVRLWQISITQFTLFPIDFYFSHLHLQRKEDTSKKSYLLDGN